MINASQDDRQFRRGVVLGLTMAEILLLLIFLLLLLLVGRIAAEKALAADAQLQRTLAEKEADNLRAELAVVQQQIDGEFDITKEYVRVKNELAAAQGELAAAKQRLAEAAPGLALLDQAKAAYPEATPEDASTRMAEAANVGRQVMEELQTINPAAGPQDLQTLVAQAETGRSIIRRAAELSPGATPEQAVENLIEAAADSRTQADPPTAADVLSQLDSCKSTLQNCQGQTAFLNERLSAQGGGFGEPPCWVSPEGRIEYIFAAHLTDTGIVLENYALAHRAKEQAALPLGAVAFGTPMNAGAFRRAVSDLFAWSVENECRFVVDLFDETGADKDHFKTLQHAVEDNFFIRERR